MKEKKKTKTKAINNEKKKARAKITYCCLYFRCEKRENKTGE